MQIDALMLCNSAEVRDGLLYVLGGGWTRCWPEPGREFPLARPLGTVFAARIAYGETNEQHTFRLEVRDSDENPLGPEQREGGFRVGRDADLSPGMSQVVQVAGSLTVQIPAPGIYSLVLSVNGREEKRIAFEALAGAPG